MNYGILWLLMCKGQCGFGFGFYYLRYGQFGPWAVSGRFLVIFGSVHSVWTAGTSCLTLVKLPGNASAFAFFTVPRKQFQISYCKWLCGNTAGFAFFHSPEKAISSFQMVLLLGEYIRRCSFHSPEKAVSSFQMVLQGRGWNGSTVQFGSGSCGSRFLRFEGYLILDGPIRQFHFGSRTLLKVSACQHDELSR